MAALYFATRGRSSSQTMKAAGSAVLNVVVAAFAEVGITGFHCPGAVDVIAAIDLAGCLGTAVVIATDGAGADGIAEVITAANHTCTDVTGAGCSLGVGLGESCGTTQSGGGSD